ncbi:MAG: hypothetical protein ACFB10_04045 [Salibacteraceae bacterium]
MSRKLKEEELASGLLKYIIISVPFFLLVMVIVVRLLNPGAFRGDMVIFSNNDPDNGDILMPPLMAYLAATVFNCGLNLLYFLQFSSRIRALGKQFKLLNFMAPGLLFLLVTLIRRDFDISLHSGLVYLPGVLNLLYGWMVWKNVRDTEVVQ